MGHAIVLVSANFYVKTEEISHIYRMTARMTMPSTSALSCACVDHQSAYLRGRSDGWALVSRLQLFDHALKPRTTMLLNLGSMFFSLYFNLEKIESNNQPVNKKTEHKRVPCRVQRARPSRQGRPSLKLRFFVEIHKTTSLILNLTPDIYIYIYPTPPLLPVNIYKL